MQKEGEALEKRMDRKIKEQEDALKIKKIKVLAGEDKFDEALDIVNQLDVNRIKLTPTLCLIGEIYMHAGMYDEAEEVLVKVYNKTPSNRRILSLLTSLYTQKGEYSEAEYYYKEFIGVASKDVHRYILRYQLDKAKGERMSVLIDTLERLKDYEYEEEWAYELASLYHKSGDDKKAIKECNEIILWFGHGLYVNKAIALKCSITGEPVPFEDENDEDIYREKEEDHVSGLTDSSIDVELIEKMLREKDGGAQKHPISETSNANKTQSNIPDDDDFEDEVTDAIYDEASEFDDEFDADMPDAHAASEDMQTTKVVNDTDMVSSKAAAGLFDALSTDSTMDFWGDVRKRRALKKAQKEAKKNQKYMTEDTPEALSEADDDDDFEDEILNQTSDDTAEDMFDAAMFSDESKKQSFVEESLDDDDDSDDFDEEFSNTLDDDFEKELFEEDLDDEDSDDENSDNISEDDNEAGNHDDDQIEHVEAEVVDDNDEDDIVQERSWTEEDKTFIDGLFGEKKSQTTNDVFSDVPDIDYVKEQLSKTFTKFEDADVEDFDILADYDINFVVLCNDSSMKAQISLGIAKALNTYGMCDKTKIFRAGAQDLNKRDFSMIFDRLQGGCLIIDEAGQLSDESAAIIEKYVDEDNQQTAIILSETQDEIMKFWKKHQTLRAKFLNVINVSKYNEMELVTLAKGYIDERKYELDEDAALVLRDYFKRELDKGQEVNYDDVIEIVDIAIANLEKRNVRNLYMTVLDNKYEEAKMFRLLPQDFKILM